MKNIIVARILSINIFFEFFDELFTLFTKFEKIR